MQQPMNTPSKLRVLVVGATRGTGRATAVSRSSVARFLSQAATSSTYVGRSVAVSGAEGLQ